MTWGAPAAWLGLVAVAIPLLVHLLARRTTRRVAFPTLRFIDPTRLTPTRQRRFTDPLLLAVRSAILVVAAAALAQPSWQTAARREAASNRVTRAIVIDATPSMSGATPDGRAGLDAARAEAAALAAGADLARTFESASPAATVRGASRWLAARGGTRELIVISDFQAGTIDEPDVQAVAAEIGLRFVRVPVAPPASTDLTFELGDRTTTASVEPTPDGTVVSWRTRASGDPSGRLQILASDGEAAAASTLTTFVRRLGAAPVGGGPTTVVLPDAPARTTLLASAHSLDAPWMFDAVDAIRTDDAVRDTAQAPGSLAEPAEGLTTVVEAPDGRVLLQAGAAHLDGVDRLILALGVGLDSPLTAAVIAAAPTSAADAARVPETEPRRIEDDVLGRWTRTAAPVSAVAADFDGASDGRWFWLLALGLLALETWLRRQPAAVAETRKEAPHVRVA